MLTLCALMLALAAGSAAALPCEDCDGETNGGGDGGPSGGPSDPPPSSRPQECRSAYNPWGYTHIGPPVARLHLLSLRADDPADKAQDEPLIGSQPSYTRWKIGYLRQGETVSISCSWEVGQTVNRAVDLYDDDAPDLPFGDDPFGGGPDFLGPRLLVASDTPLGQVRTHVFEGTGYRYVLTYKVTAP